MCNVECGIFNESTGWKTLCPLTFHIENYTFHITHFVLHLAGIKDKAEKPYSALSSFPMIYLCGASSMGLAIIIRCNSYETPGGGWRGSRSFALHHPPSLFHQYAACGGSLLFVWPERMTGRVGVIQGGGSTPIFRCARSEFPL